MSVAAVRLLAGRYEVSLGDDVQIVPSAQVVLSVAGARSRNAFLDGRAVRLSSGEVGLLSVDLVRSTGFHRFTVDGETYWFGTEDAKLGLAGIVTMLDELGTMGTGWTGQAMFSDGSGMRDPHVAYGWLDQWADEALGAVAAVIETPRANQRTTRALRRRGGAGVLLAPTLRLLRSDPRRYLAEAPGGIIEADGRRFEPLRVVARKRDRRGVHHLEVVGHFFVSPGPGKGRLGFFGARAQFLPHDVVVVAAAQEAAVLGRGEAPVGHPDDPGEGPLPEVGLDLADEGTV